MAQQNEHSQMAKHYLLGTLPKEEEAQFEKRYFADAALFNQIEIEEDELVDAYVQERLSESDREQFEQTLSHSERLQERVAFSRSLLTKASAAKKSQRVTTETVPWWNRLSGLFATPAALKTAFASSLVLLLVAGAAITMQSLSMRRMSQQLAAERQLLEQQRQRLEQQIAETQANTQGVNAELQTQKAELETVKQQLAQAEQQLAQSLEASGAPIPKFLTLLPGSVRAPNDARELRVSTPNTLVKINLVLDSDDYPTYRVSIASADSRTPITRSGVKAQGPTSQRLLVIQFRASELPAGDYAVNVSGHSPDGSYDRVADYRFRFVKQ